MSQGTYAKPSQTPVRLRRFRIAAAVAIALALAFIIWLIVRDDDNSSSEARAVSADEIRTLANSVGHPVFWVGPQEGRTYELTRQENGTIIIRYLPQGAEVGDKKPYLSVATYPFPGAFPAIEKAADQPNSGSFKIPEDGLAVYAKRYPQSIHVAYPGTNYQAEVFDPKRRSAAALLRSGQLTALGDQGGRASSASQGELRSLARSVRHPVYWVGPQANSTYELIRASGGKIIIRYLPSGEEIGSQKPYLSVATYPFQGAFRAIQELAKQESQVAIKLPDGGLAVYDRSYPKSIHLAYPGSDYQVEVFDPSAERVRGLVSSGQVSNIG
jgi:hypothetical protein